MLDKNTTLQVGQVYFEDDRHDNIVLFCKNRIEAIIGDELAVTRVLPDGSGRLFIYSKKEFYDNMLLEEPTDEEFDSGNF